jgi:N-acetylglucosaminyl-diphospho-decaprenol L-rhamnosyltransferase
VATDRPLHVVIADNGSTDGAPEEAVEAAGPGCYAPGGPRSARPVNRGGGARASRPMSEFVLVANPDVVWGPGSIDAIGGGRRWPQAGSAGAVDPRSGRRRSTRRRRHLPSLVRGGMHAVRGFRMEDQPVAPGRIAQSR